MSLMCFEKIKRAKCVLFPFLSFHFFPRTEQLFYHSVMVEGPVSMSNSNGLARLSPDMNAHMPRRCGGLVLKFCTFGDLGQSNMSQDE